ncbi:hypothetical protein [Phycisphaera mikurensis]|uniref:PEP-CTERM protein-sorting domain-containing protein n=1 Tax=Phycisphaera mikurensis (strain NBRC 102666 / KCTC 22515 / FYK2301M01) TaxID=1142394 RepID=I0IFP5_PHYMF|nr:hypothetical protein [Phycisphaera mikurensis]MBB6440527.1 hypothetical protein [Phycisphaera mikurensis]BAM04083.1 hypothetical protein PSMK_19240 [Phycisphaera mikurensis NBRC 102666]
MRPLPLLSAALSALVAALPAAAATVVFEDDFDDENAPSHRFVRNYTGFANFEVTRGGVDLIGNGRLDHLPGNGLYVELDGKKGTGGGTLRFNADLDGLAGPLEVSFDLAGSQRQSGGVVVSLQGERTRYNFNRDDDFRTFTLRTESAEDFELLFIQGGSDGIGILLDNVVITSLAEAGDGGAGGDGGHGGGDADEGNGGADTGTARPAVAVPVPGAAAAGILLLGGLAARRRQRD